MTSPKEPPEFDEETERAIKVACEGPPFPPEVIKELRALLLPHAKRVPPAESR